jgi:hypothetical protein
VPACPSGIGSAYDRIFLYMTLEGLHYLDVFTVLLLSTVHGADHIENKSCDS